MNPRITKGQGITGAIRYAQGEGRDPVTRLLRKLAPGEQSRVEFFGGVGFFWPVKTADDVEHARREMEFDALNQRGQCRQDCVHLMLAWRPGETPTREHMAEQVKSALAAIGMANAKALYFAHNDEDYRHIHVVASKINPATGYAYDLKGDYLQLSTWAEHYEAEHGGVISVNRATNNELRAAIAARDAGAVLEAMTRQRATFTPAQLEGALAKQIRNQNARAQFAEQVLAHPETVRLAEKADGPAVRYSTRAVIEAELHVLRAAAGLAADTTHGIDERQRAAILASDQFRTMSAGQARAFRHVTGAEGLALIDGQAGTGKSYTIAAVRQAYEAAGCNVVGLGPTNAVAQDMTADGFGHAATIHSELFALNTGRRNWSAKTVVIVDEAAMIDTKLMAMVTAWTADSRAKLILVGDDRQLSSIDRGGMFGALKDRYGAAELSEVKRQHKLDERRASEWMAAGNFHDALNLYDRKGSIHWTRTQGEARAALIAQWAKDSAAQPDKSRFVFAYTNDDVAQLNAALRDVRKERGGLGEDHGFATKHGRADFARGDRIMFTGSAKKQGIINGHAGTIEAIDGSRITVTLDGRRAKTVTIDAASFDQFRHAYAGTIYKAQGRTLDQTYLYHSEHWRSAASYVALTRHRDKAELFVATNTAADVKQLARQMGRTDDRRAASQFHYAQQIDAAPLTAAELQARFSADAAPSASARSSADTRKDPEMDEQKSGIPLAANQNERAQTTAQPASETLDQMEERHRDEWELVHGAYGVEELPSQLERRHTDERAAHAAHEPPSFPASGDNFRTLTGDEARETFEAWAAMQQPDPTNQNSYERVAPVPEQREPPAAPPPEVAAVREAWQQPAFSYETIKADPWTAVYLSAPENASPALLNVAYNAAARCIEALDSRPVPYADAITHGPLMPQDTEADNRAMAEMRRNELHAMIFPIGAPAAEQPRRERIAQLEAAAHAAAREMLQAPEERIAFAAAQEPLQTPEPLSAPAQPETAATATGGPQIGAAAAISDEANPPLPARPDAINFLRGARHFLEGLGDRVATVFHFLADAVSPPPKLTPQQIHDRLQAAPEGGNLEAINAQANAETAAQTEAAYDWMQHEASRAEQQANLSLADRFGTPPTSEAVIGLGHGGERDWQLDRD